MLLLFLLGTFIAVSSPPKFGVEKEIQPILEDVVRLSKGNIQGTVPIHWGDIDTEDKDYLGMCYHRIINYIRIDKKDFEKLNRKSKVILLAHELGHCECGSSHINGYSKDGCPLHFMNRVAPDRSCIRKHWRKYISQTRKIDC